MVTKKEKRANARKAGKKKVQKAKGVSRDTPVKGTGRRPKGSKIVCLQEAGITSAWVRQAFLDMGNDPSVLRNHLIEKVDELAEQKRRMVLSTVKQYDSLEYIRSRAEKVKAAGGNWRREAAYAFGDLVSGGGARQRTGTLSLERDYQTIYYQVQREFGDVMEELRYMVTGLNNSRRSQRNMIKAIRGEAVDDDVARAAGEAWRKVTTQLMDRFNLAGGAITRLEDWGIPMFHDAVRVKNGTFEVWSRDIKDLIDQDRLIGLTPERKATLSAEGKEVVVDRVLKSIYNNLASDGIIPIDKQLFGVKGKKMLANRHQEHRLLHFKNGDAWLKYSDKYGRPDYFGAMMGYAEVMSKEIAAMEKFGPNSDQVVENIRKALVKYTGEANAGTGAVFAYDNMMGRSFGAKTGLGEVFRTVRALETATKLGMSPITAMTDVGFTFATARFNGIPAFKSVWGMMKNLNPTTNKENRMLLNHMGFGAEYALDQAIGAARFTEASDYGRAARFADTAVRASGLNYWTNAAKQSFKLEMLQNYTRLTKSGYNQLPRRVRLSLERYGINQEDWGKIQRAGNVNKNGAEYLNMDALDADTSAKVVGSIIEETRFAVPEPDAYTRGLMTQGLPTNTLRGEAIRTVGQFKAFPISILTSHFARAVDQGLPGGAAYLSGLIIPVTILGAISLQAKEIIKGNTPRDMANMDFLKDAIVKGGALGIIGDILSLDPERGGGFWDSVVGPVASDVRRLATFAYGTYDEVKKLEMDVWAESIAEGVVDAGQILEPKLWWYRLVLDRWMYQSLQKLYDPHYNQKQVRTRNRLNKMGQREWWASGDMYPRF